MRGGGKKFQAEVDMSGTTFGKQLDFKPLGATAAPWRIPVCPRDGFVVYQDKFTDEELADLRGYVASAEYKVWVAKKETSYYLLARLLEHRAAPAKQVDTDAGRYADYAAHSMSESAGKTESKKPAK